MDPRTHVVASYAPAAQSSTATGPWLVLKMQKAQMLGIQGFSRMRALIRIQDRPPKFAACSDVSLPYSCHLTQGNASCTRTYSTLLACFLHAVRSPPLFPVLSASLCPHPAWCAVHMTCSLRFALAGVVLGLGPIDSLAAWTLTDDPRLFGQRTRLPDVSAKAPL